MAELSCKIKALLEKNDLALSQEFIDYMSLDENLAQLSKLIHLLKIKDISTIYQIQDPLIVDDLFIDSATISSDAQMNLIQDVNNLDEHEEKEKLEFLALSDDEQIDQDNLKANKVSDAKSIEVQNHDVNVINDHTDLNTATQDTNSDVFIAEIADQPIMENSVQSEIKNDAALNDHHDATNAQGNSSESPQVLDPMFLNTIKFQVDNARVGQAYSSKIFITSKHDASLIQFKPDSFKFSREHFYFDEESQSIKGQPEIAEEMTFSFQYCFQNETRTTQCKINVIPDPKSLWRVVEPEAGQRFEKVHLDHAMIDLEKYKLIAASRRGRSHEHGGTFRDDDFAILQIEDTPWSVITVADGAGSAEYSREGSRIAVEIVKNEFARYLHGDTILSLNQDVENWKVGSQDQQTQEIATKLNQQFYHVYYEIYKSIINQIEKQAADIHVAPKIFSTTLLVAVIYSHKQKTFVSTFSVGDGAIAVYNDTHVRIMNVSDGGEYAGQTKFLDRSIAQEFGARVKIGCFTEIDAVMVMTDGISDPIFETDMGLSNHEKWKKLYLELNPLMQMGDADRALLEWIHFFVPGHHDDRTMAVLWKSAHESNL